MNGHIFIENEHEWTKRKSPETQLIYKKRKNLSGTEYEVTVNANLDEGIEISASDGRNVIRIELKGIKVQTETFNK